MYRVELKEKKGGRWAGGYPPMFLMYRVELKVDAELKKYIARMLFLMYRVELKGISVEPAEGRAPCS